MASASAMALSKEDLDYQKAVSQLNTLQTTIVQEVCDPKKEEEQRRDEHHHHRDESKLLEVEKYLQRCDITLSDLNRLNAIHVTGTKGKGSVCAMCESILRHYNLKTGFFSSPHLLEVRERIRLNGKSLSKEQFVHYFWECYNKFERTKEQGMPAYFKFLTVLSFYVFLKENVDVAMVEVGVGGAYDITNLIPRPSVCAISSLGYDHMDVLGETLEKIAWQKGGIFKKTVPAFTSPLFPGPMRVLAERAKELKASSLQVAPPLQEYPSITDDSESAPLTLGIAGDHQKSNASLVAQICRSWLQRHGKWKNDPAVIDDSSGDKTMLHGIPLASPFTLTREFREGLEECRWPGRSQIVNKGHATYYLDGAHTPQSIMACSNWFKSESSKEAKTLSGKVIRVLLFNVSKQRDSRLLLHSLLDCGFNYATFSPSLAFPQGKNTTDQTNLRFTMEYMLKYAKLDREAWLKVTRGQQAWEEILSSYREKREGLVTTAPDPASLCTTSLPDNATLEFPEERARLFGCISDVVEWCQSLTAGGDSDGADSHVQVLVTGSLYLVSTTMTVLGCKVDGL